MEQEGVLYSNRHCRHHTSIPLGGSQLSHIALTFCMPLGHLFYLVTSPKQKGNAMMSRKELGSSNQFFFGAGPEVVGFVGFALCGGLCRDENTINHPNYSCEQALAFRWAT